MPTTLFSIQESRLEPFLVVVIFLDMFPGTTHLRIHSSGMLGSSVLGCPLSGAAPRTSVLSHFWVLGILLWRGVGNMDIAMMQNDIVVVVADMQASHIDR